MLEVLANVIIRRNKSQTDWTGSNKIVTMDDKVVNVKKETLKTKQTRKLLKLRRQFNNVTGYSVNIQKSIIFLYTDNDSLETKNIYNSFRKTCIKFVT